MMEKINTVKKVKEYYDSAAEGEYYRIANRPEFLLTCRFIDRYVKKGDKVLDIGGGPGRYSIYLAQKGCDVTLFDLSSGNIEFAKEKASELFVTFKTVCGDAREVDCLVDEQFDYILLMGPMYHLLDEVDRVKAINASLKLLKPNGIIFVSFISMMGGIIYAMKLMPEIIISNEQMEVIFRENFINRKDFAGEAFTHAYFAEQNEILPFMSQFPLEKIHFFGQEGITSPCEDKIMSQPPNVIDAWLDLCEKVCERDELLSWSEHLMYIGRKK